MTSRRGALVLATMAAALQTASAEPCAPRAALDGDADAIARVTAELQRLGITVERAGAGGSALRDPRCPAIVAAVELDRGGGIAVAVRDGTNRSEGRVVSDAALAAAWIDSWIHDDFAVATDESAESVGRPARTAMPPGVTPMVTPPPADIASGGAPAGSPLDRFAVAATYLDTFAFDGTRPSGVGGAACVKAGAFCIGARAIYTTQTMSLNLTGAARSDAALLATASWAYELGRMSIVPELGVGVGRMAVERIDGCPPPPPACDPADPTCQPAPAPACNMTDPGGTGGGSGSGSGYVYVGDNFHMASYTPRVAASVRIEIPLFEHVWLEGIASVMLTPFAHTTAFVPATSSPIFAPEQIALPGEASGSTQLGIGLRVGVP